MEFKINDLNIYNVLASISVLKELKIDVLKLKTKYKNLESSEGRGKKYLIKRYNKIQLIDESYTNPLSVKYAIKRFSLIKKEI